VNRREIIGAVNVILLILATVFVGLATNWNGWAMGATVAGLLFIGAGSEATNERR
jgi:TRAP-type mannitol/chloroaromatic compound transport system permease large subunit